MCQFSDLFMTRSSYFYLNRFIFNEILPGLDGFESLFVILVKLGWNVVNAFGFILPLSVSIPVSTATTAVFITVTTAAVISTVVATTWSTSTITTSIIKVTWSPASTATEFIIIVSGTPGTIFLPVFSSTPVTIIPVITTAFMMLRPRVGKMTCLGYPLKISRINTHYIFLKIPIFFCIFLHRCLDFFENIEIRFVTIFKL